MESKKKLVKGFKPGLRPVLFDRYMKDLWDKYSEYTIHLGGKR